jgi:hypothetical protein
MNTETPTTCGGWEEELPAMPARSKLYLLAAEGVGTVEVESLTSYVSRLAIAQSVSTWSLLKCEIGPRLYGLETVLRSRLGELVATTGAALNGENRTSRKVVSILKELTCSSELHLLTMGFCKGFVSSRHLVSVQSGVVPRMPS